jgi:ligand-binding SRPBCC domain-containing protein
MVKKMFEHRSVINGSVQQVWDFHAHPKAFIRLTPPPIFIQMLRNDLKSLREGDVEFRMWVGPIPLYWHARHEKGPTETSFIDRMLNGPMAYWEHQHIFREAEGGTELVDRVTLEHKPGLAGVLTRLMFDGLPLRLFFTYRHLRTRLGMSNPVAGGS